MHGKFLISANGRHRRNDMPKRKRASDPTKSWCRSSLYVIDEVACEARVMRLKPDGGDYKLRSRKRGGGAATPLTKYSFFFEGNSLTNCLSILVRLRL